MMCYDDSVMENLPPVILTDEDICLEIVEKGKLLSAIVWSKLMQGLSSFLIKFVFEKLCACNNMLLLVLFVSGTYLF